MKCPYCGEEINNNAKKCKYCGEWLNIENRRQKIISWLKKLFIGICVVAVFIICQNLFMNPFKELTRGCSSDGETLFPLGTKLVDTETYFCKNKPWIKVWKHKNNYSEHFTYDLYTQNSKGNDELRATLYWDRGDYHCEIRSEIYLDTNNLLGGYVNNKYDILYADICTPREFVKLAKKYLRKNSSKQIIGSEKAETADNHISNSSDEDIQNTKNTVIAPSDFHFEVSYEQAIKDYSKPMIILFYVNWDSYSINFMPIYKKLYEVKNQYYNFVKIDVEDPKYTKIVEKFNISAFPTVYMLNTKTGRKEQLKNENFDKLNKLYELMDNFYNSVSKEISNNPKHETQTHGQFKKPSDYTFGISYEQAIKDYSKPMIILFYADWCKFSQRFMPIYETMYEKEKKYYNFVKINVDDSKYLPVVKKYEIEAMPTVFLVNTKTDEKEQLENKDFGDISLLFNLMVRFATRNGYYL